MRLVRGLEIGVNDYLVPPIDKNELLAPVRTQVRKRRYVERLRDDVQTSLELAITDALTGLHNRRYMERHIGTLVEQAASRDQPLALLMLDVDHFKVINDSYGHDAGDEVLREFALRIRKSIRGLDLACRYGGEEFLVIMPENRYVGSCPGGGAFKARDCERGIRHSRGGARDRCDHIGGHRGASRRG
jgi:two-component system cell cycle response regulator